MQSVQAVGTATGGSACHDPPGGGAAGAPTVLPVATRGDDAGPDAPGGTPGGAPAGAPVGALALVLGGIVSVQLGAAVAVTVFDRVGPTGAVALRLAGAAVILLVAVRPRLRGRTRRDWAVAVAYGLVTQLVDDAAFAKPYAVKACFCPLHRFFRLLAKVGRFERG